MADKDTVTKDYMQDKETFADVFNYYIYGGEQVIKPEQLKEVDTTTIALPYGDDNKVVPIQKYRDVMKMVTAMEDDHAAYLLLGIENQSDIHYAMPVRNMLYDAMQYAAQVSNTAKSHRKAHDKAETNAEFLSGFYKTDKLLPVITLTVYFGAEEWDAPRSLYDMLSVSDNKLMQYISDYKLNLIAPAEIEDSDFNKFHTELRLALKYLKYSKSEEKLDEALNHDTAFKDVSKRTVDMLCIVTGSDIEYDKTKERVDMCEAIEGMKRTAMEKGKTDRDKELIEKMRRQGFTEEQIKALFGKESAK